jgi:hypothetical protein
MSTRPHETTEVHTRLLRCALEIEDARAYWTHAAAPGMATAARAFEEYWFGARSLSRIEELLSNMQIRFNAFPAALGVLQRWPDMSPDTRRVICHWHLQLADPLYRDFTGGYLATRRAGPRASVTRDLVVEWVGRRGADRWTMATRIQFASKLLSAAYSAGLVATNRDPRPVAVPRVPDEALEYLLYLLRDVTFVGTLFDNPYVASVDLTGGALEARLRGLSGLTFSRQGDVVEFGWRHADLDAWRTASVPSRDLHHAGAAQ